MIAGFAACVEAGFILTVGVSMVGLPASDKNWRAQCEQSFGLPAKSDLRQLALQNGRIFGVLAVTRLRRLVQDLPSQHAVQAVADIAADGAGAIWYEFSGSSQQGRRPRVWLKVQAVVTLICQRCLGPMQFVVDESVEFELFGNEASADEALGHDDVDPQAPEPLVVDGPTDLVDLIEDQLILAIPYVPRHQVCEPAKTAAGEPIEPVKRESPFKVLEGLKRDPK